MIRIGQRVSQMIEIFGGGAMALIRVYGVPRINRTSNENFNVSLRFLRAEKARRGDLIDLILQTRINGDLLDVFGGRNVEDDKDDVEEFDTAEDGPPVANTCGRVQGQGRGRGQGEVRPGRGQGEGRRGRGGNNQNNDI